MTLTQDLCIYFKFHRHSELKGTLWQVPRKSEMLKYSSLSEANKFPEGFTFPGSFIQLKHRITIRPRELAHSAANIP